MDLHGLHSLIDSAMSDLFFAIKVSGKLIKIKSIKMAFVALKKERGRGGVSLIGTITKTVLAHIKMLYSIAVMIG